MSNEFVNMETVRTAIGSLISFEKELLTTYRNKVDPFGAYACEKTICVLERALRTIELYADKESEKEAV